MLMLYVRLADALSPGLLLQGVKCDFLCNATIRNVLKSSTSDSCVRDHDGPAAFDVSVNAAGGVVG